MTRDEWRWTDEQGVQRLVRTDELRAALASAVLPASTLVWREGMKEWAPASTMPELASATVSAAMKVRSAVDTKPGMTAPRDVGTPTPPLNIAGGDAAAGTDKRAMMRTLVGISGPEGERPSVPSPISVPSAGKLEPQNRAVITQVPRFDMSKNDMSKNDLGAHDAPAYGDPPFASPAIPPAPRMPSETGLGTESPKADAATALNERTARTSFIDGAWSDEDETLPRQSERPSAHDIRPATPGRFSASSDASETKSGSAPPARRPTNRPPPLVRKPKPVEPVEAPSSGPISVDPADVVPMAPGPMAPVPVAPSGDDKLGGMATMRIGTPPKVPTRAPPKPPLKPRPAPPEAAKAETESSKPATKRPPPPLPVRAERPKPPVRPPLAKNGGVAALSPFDVTTAKEPDQSDVTKTEALPIPAAPSEGAQAASPAPAPAATEEARPAADASPTATKSDPPTAPFPIPGGPLDVVPGAAPHAAAAPPMETPAMDEPRAKLALNPPPAATNGEMLPRPPMRSEPPPRMPMPSQPPPADGDARRPMPSQPPGRTPLTSRPPRDSLSDASREARRSRPPKLNEPVEVPVSSLLGAGGALIAMVISAFFVGRCSAVRGEGHALAHATFTELPARARAALPAPPKPCWVSRQPVQWAPRASTKIPFELLATPAGSIALGYARDATEAAGLEMNPKTGEIKEKYNEKTSTEIDRVVPLPSSPNGFVATTTEVTGGLKLPIAVASTPPFSVGLTSGSIAIGDIDGVTSSPLWPIEGDEPWSAARVQDAGEHGYAVTFRRGGAIWAGWIGRDKKPVGTLTRVVGSGGGVGKPMSGFNGHEIALIFADRPDEQTPWEVRVGHAAAGSIPATTEVFPLPKGGPGGDAFAPDLVGLSDGRWLVAWTEGPAGSRAIRAQTLASDFSAVGDPIALSPPAGSFGQSVLGEVNGNVAAVFLLKGDSSYELWGAVLSCGM